VIKPWLQQASNCVAPKASVEKLLQWAQTSGYILAFNDLASFCGGPFPTSNFVAPDGSIQLASGDFYNPNTQAPNGGRGFYADLGGKQLPNSPHWTGNVGTQYTFFTASGDFTLRGDYYRQSSSYARIYNTVSDKLRGWGNANLSLTWQAAKSDLTVQLYVKNLFNDTPITDAFVNSDDSGLTTNVFTLDPRIYGISVRMGFN
jgi:outer membrane receptor protein involved in Fe transport